MRRGSVPESSGHSTAEQLNEMGLVYSLFVIVWKLEVRGWIPDIATLGVHYLRTNHNSSIIIHQS
jgi:hypothetical protein